MKTKTKVHRVVLMIVDTDEVGAGGVTEVLENQKFPNYCISPNVMSIETAEVDWSDEHPLNQRATSRTAFEALFSKEKR